MKRQTIRRKTVIRKRAGSQATKQPSAKIKKRWKSIDLKRKSLRYRGLRSALLEKNWINRAYAAGEQQAVHQPLDMAKSEAEKKKIVNHLWSQWFLSSPKKISWKLYVGAARSFLQGFSKKSGMIPPDWVLVPTLKSVGAIITVMNEEKTISDVMQQLGRLPLDEIIVVVNGSTDDSFNRVRNESNAIIVHYPQPLGHDVGRAIGAKAAESDILLFLDGDFSIAAEDLVPFIYGIHQGLDVALNNISPYLRLFSSWDSVSMLKEFVNRSMGRADLGANSLTAVPHALSRKAVEAIGCKNLVVPPKAQMIAIRQGLSIGSPVSVDVITKNRIRNTNVGHRNQVARMIIGDHLEAVRTATALAGKRLSFQDRTRNRSLGGLNDN